MSHRQGFTLIELLIVVAIIGILASLLIPNAMTAMQKAKVRGTQKDIGTIASTLVDFLTDRSTPPANNGTITTTLKSALSPMYIKVLPLRDQWGTTFYIYTGTSVDSNYGISGGLRDDFMIASRGKDKALESWTYNAASPEAGLYSILTPADFNRDIINFDGGFIRGPRAGL